MEHAAASDRLVYSRPHRGRNLFAMMLASSLLTSCSVFGIDRLTSDTSETSAPIPTASSLHPEFVSPDSACTGTPEQTTSQHTQEALAQACLELYKQTNVALINYSLSHKKAKKLADGIEAIVERATKHRINIDIAVIEPSAAARRLFKKLNPDGCVELEEGIWQLGAYSAAATMPSLATSDKVIGTSTEEPCKGDIAGIAYTVPYNRYAEIFNSKQAVEDIPYATHAEVGAHELLHLFGLHHAGRLLQGESLEDAARRQSKLDLNKYIKEGVWLEYGDGSNIMGSSVNPGSGELNAAQLEMLDWPHAILSAGTKDSSTDLHEKAFMFDGSSKPDTFAYMSLDEPLILPGENSPHDDSPEFNRLAVTPIMAPMVDSNKSKPSQVYGFALHLANDQSTVSIGEIYSSQGKQTTHSFEIDGHVLSVTLSNDGLTVSQLNR